MSSESTTHANPWDEQLPQETSLFLAIVPDKSDSKRAQVRQAHLKDAAVAHARGWIIQGGPTFADQSDPSKMTGSWLLARAKDEQDLVKRMTQDVYTRGGAWDMTKVQITRVGASL